jgi:transcription factor C subunit 6
MSRRQSTRARKATNYDIKDAFKDLSDDPETPPHLAQDDEASDDDFAVPDQNDEGPNDDSGDEGNISEAASSGTSEDYGDSGSDAAQTSKTPKTPKTTRPAKAPSATPGGNIKPDENGTRKLHKTHSISEDLRRVAVQRKHMRLEDGSKIDLRIPDASVRITYRPGFSKACGKKDRVQHIYGVNMEDLVKCTYVRDRAFGLPAVPTRSSLGLTPFWDLEKEARKFVEVGWEAQKVTPLTYGDEKDEVHKYLPKEPEEDIRCMMGLIGKMKIVEFKRFRIHSLSDVKEGRNGFLLNTGGAPAAMDWAQNRPEGHIDAISFASTWTDLSDRLPVPSDIRGLRFECGS